MTVTNNNVAGVHKKEWQFMTPMPVASAAGSFVVTDGVERDNLVLYVQSATVHYLASHDEDAAPVQIPSLALAGVFGAGACGERQRWSNTLTANGGSSSTVTTTSVINSLAIGKTIRFYTGALAGKDVVCTGVIVNPGGTSTLQFATQGASAANTDTFAVSTGRFFILNAYATVAAGVFKSYDPLTGVVTTLTTTNLPAAWGTDGRIVSTPSDEIFASGTATGGTTTLLTNSAKTWTVNQWTNYQVKATSGAGVVNYRTVASNTATGIVPTVAFTFTPDGTTTYEITGNDDFLYILGNNVVTMYKYSVSANTITAMAPTTARAAALVTGGSANWVAKTGDANWADESNIKDGRYIYSMRGGASAVLDRFDIAGGTAGAGAWAAITYTNQAETFTTGSSYALSGNYLYIRKDATHRFFKYSIRGNRLEGLTQNLYQDGTAVVGDKLWLWNFRENNTNKIKYLYSLRNTGSEVFRMQLNDI